MEYVYIPTRTHLAGRHSGVAVVHTQFVLLVIGSLLQVVQALALCGQLAEPLHVLCGDE